MLKKFYKSFYIDKRLYIALASTIVLFTFGYFFKSFYVIGKVSLLLLIALFIIDFLLLYLKTSNTIIASRTVPERFSNGDENAISLLLENNYPYKIWFIIIDEIPFQFQKRDFNITGSINSGEEQKFHYSLRPVERGEYKFGHLNVYINSSIGLLTRRYRFESEATIPVYPSFIQMRKYEIMAISNRLTELGIKKIRRISMNNEFDQIKEYVQGDDYRTINWRATARKSRLMVNQYQDEKAQHVVCIIDKGRTMRMPFEGMTLLDYAINSSLVISNIAMYKQDKAGLITFSKTIDSVLTPGKRNNQLLLILEMLYKQRTNFVEANYELLYATVRRTLKQRSLLLLYTNFEGLSSLKRQMKFFQQLAKNHLLVVIFFKNTEINSLLNAPAPKLEDVYIKTIAEKFMYEKKLIIKELQKYGIHSILTEPQNLTVDTINKYLELKAVGLI